MLQLVPQAVAQDAGPFTFPGARIVGVGDITQFIVKAHSTQTNNLVEIQANDGSRHVTITGLGETIMDVTSTEALLVRKNADGGDVLIVDTTNSQILVDGSIYLTDGDQIGISGNELLTFNAAGTAAFSGCIVSIAGTGAGSRLDVFDGDILAKSTAATGRAIIVDGNFAQRSHILLRGSGTERIVLRREATTHKFQISTDQGATFKFTMDTSGRIAFGGPDSPSGQLHVDQASASGAIPVLLLDQGDIDVEFLRLVGSSEDGEADRSLVDVADMTTPGALVGWFQIYVEDVQGTNPITDGVYYVPFYAAPSA